MNERTRARTTAGVVVVLTLGALGLAAAWFLLSDGAVARRAHGDALARWETQEPEAYSFEFSSCGGMCANCPVRVTVAHGEVTAVVALGGEGCGAPDRATAPTIEDVFDLEARWRTASTTDSFTIAYDPVRGFPASGSFRCPDGWSDCGSGFVVSDLEVLVDAP